MDKVAIDVKRGVFGLDFGGSGLRNLRFGFEWSEDFTAVRHLVLFDSFTQTSDVGAVRLEARSGGFEVSLTIERGLGSGSGPDGFVRLSAEFRNRSGRDIRLWNIIPVMAEGGRGSVFAGLSAAPEDSAFYAYCRPYASDIIGFPSICGSDNDLKNATWGVHTVFIEFPEDCVRSRANWYVSQDFGGLFAKGSGIGLFAGFDRPGVAFGDVCVNLTGDTEGICLKSCMDGILVSSGESREAESVVVMYGKPYPSSVVWARLCAEALGARHVFSPLSGYCSWYRRYNKVDAPEIEAAIEQYSRLPRGADVVQIDDGFEITAGEWMPNAKFPEGLQALAEKISAAGLMPGIWLAPYFVHETSPAYKEHPDWIQRLPDGRPAVSFPLWKDGPAYSIDPTKPEAIEFMHGWVSRMVHEWGYKYIKFDFLYAHSIGAVFHDPRQTSFQMMRASYKLFREAAGDDIYLMCCSGFAARYALGYVDAARIGPDCGTVWSGGTENAMKCAIMRANVNEIWWWNDPDVYYLREERLNLTFDEKLFFATVTAMTGGLTLSSDLPETWAPEALEVYDRIVPPAGIPFYPIDDPNGGMSTVLCVNRPDGDGEMCAFAAALHWDEGGDVELDFGGLGLTPGKAYHVYDFWNHSYVGVRTGGYTCPRGKPHSLNLFAIRPAAAAASDGPALAGDTTHAISGVTASRKGGVLILDWQSNARGCESAETFTVVSDHKPEIGGLVNCRHDGTELTADAGVWEIRVTAQPGRCIFTVR